MGFWYSEAEGVSQENSEGRRGFCWNPEGIRGFLFGTIMRVEGGFQVNPEGRRVFLGES